MSKIQWLLGSTSETHENSKWGLDFSFVIQELGNGRVLIWKSVPVEVLNWSVLDLISFDVESFC